MFVNNDAQERPLWVSDSIMGDDNNYADSKNAPSPYANKNAKTPAKPASPPTLPQVNVLFFVLSSVTNKKIDEFIKSSMSWLSTIWKPKDDDLKRFEITFVWDGTFKSVTDKDRKYRRIEFRTKGGSPAALQLVKDNYSNPNFNAEVPVFICEVAWDEDNERGEPRDGELRGITLVKSLPWFTGERAIFLFSSAASQRTLAHEMSHWVGFSHLQYKEDPGNIAAIGGSGLEVDRDEFRKLHKWATDLAYRKQLAAK